MKTLFISMVVALMLAGCKSSEITEENTEQAIELYTIEDLMGNWKLIRYEYDQKKQSLVRFRSAEAVGYNAEHDLHVLEDSKHILHPYIEETYISTTDNYLRIESDSMFWLNYPLEMHGRAAYRLDSNKVWLRRSFERQSLSMSEDRQEMNFSYLDVHGLYITEFYEKVEFDDSLIGILKAHDLNYPLLAGKWGLIREETDDFGELYVHDFPHQVPDTLMLSSNELKIAMLGDKSLMIQTDASKKKYFIRYENQEIKLIPDTWFDLKSYTERTNFYEVWLRYRKSETDLE